MFSHAIIRSLVFFIFILSILPPTDAVFDIFDYAECALSVNTTYSINPNKVHLLDENGKPTSDFSNAWGITYEDCRTFCVGNATFIDWNLFSTQLLSWLLPWVALTAQLPFETRSTFFNFQALFLAVGSPLLIIYSLSLTMLNDRSINDAFRQIKEDVEILDRPKQTEAVKAARILLIESQNVPIQIVNGRDRELAQLVVDPENWAWWPAAANEILKTKRGWTYSLIAQLVFVVVSQLFSIVDYFTSKADEDTISVGLGINSVWVWMIPVTLGWVLVGTQTSAGSIRAAFKSTVVPRLSGERNVAGRCVGVTDRTRYGTRRTSRHRSSATMAAYVRAQRELGGIGSSVEDMEFQDDTKTTVQETVEEVDQDTETQLGQVRQSFFGFDIAGDDEEPGPIFNYARVWSHMNAVAHFVHAFTTSIELQGNKCTVKGSNLEPWNPNDYESNLAGTPEEMSRYISENYEDIEDLSVHSNPLPAVRLNCVIAAIVAFFLFYGTTGAGFLIAYETPTVGIGCDSGSYLLYGIVATIVWILLTTSAYLSHLCALGEEREHPQTRPMIASIAVITRLSGKSLAFLNACDIIVTSMLQFTNLYNNCWCSGSVLGRGVKAAWVILFATDAQIASASTAFWIAGVFLSLAVAFIGMFFFWVSKGSEIFRENTQ